MLYALYQAFKDIDFPGNHLMGYISFRTGVAFTLAMLIALVAGKHIIRRLQLMQVGEVVRNLGLEGQMKKTGTPTMGGILIIISILVPAFIIGNLSNIYMILMIVATLWMGAIGFLDDYRKLKYHNKDGLKGKYKITGQIGLGLIVGITMWLSPDIVVRQNVEVHNFTSHETEVMHLAENVKTPITTIPFVKNNNFNYQWLTSWIDNPHTAEILGWLVFVVVVIFVVTAVSNGANLTDGLDGLCAGTSATIGLALAVMAYLGGNIIYATYLNIMYIPGSEELVVYAGAFLGALIGFLWYNAYPAQVFMGDTGSLTLGGILAVFAILTRKELLIPLLCLVFFVEDLSVILQVVYFKITKRKYGEGRRIFKMTPLHHHFQKDADPTMKVLWARPVHGIPEPKIVTRFWIVSLLLATLTFVTLKLR